jgi:hypothetical protein
VLERLCRDKHSSLVNSQVMKKIKFCEDFLEYWNFYCNFLAEANFLLIIAFLISKYFFVC